MVMSVVGGYISLHVHFLLLEQMLEQNDLCAIGIECISLI
jgi:hypothetical protein